MILIERNKVMNHNNNNTASSKDKIAHAQTIFKGTYSEVLGLKLLACEDGYCRAMLPIKDEFLNPLGGLHGGFMYTIADTVGGVAASRQGDGQSVTTISGTMQFYRAALNLTELYAEAKVVKDGKRVVFVDTEITSNDGTVYSKASFSFARFQLPKDKTIL